MRPTLKIGLIFPLLACLMGLWLFFRPVGHYQALSCERLELSHNGKALIGIEDMAYDTRLGKIYLSAYDRRTGEPGGIYYFSSTDKDSAVTRLSLPQTDAQSYWPHGFSFTHDDKGQIYLDVIERDLKDPDTMRAHISLYHWQSASPDNIQLLSRIEKEALCAANNVTRAQQASPHSDGSQSFYITQDHQSCNAKAQKREDIISPRSSSLLHYRQDEDKLSTIWENLSYANGIALTSKAYYLAETRGKKIHIFGLDADNKIDPLGAIKLPGGPDNLSVHNDQIIAALHPNLIRFAAYRAGWGPRVKSRISIISPHKQVSNYDIASQKISGATIALIANDKLYLGAAYDEGLAVCELPQGLK